MYRKFLKNLILVLNPLTLFGHLAMQQAYMYRLLNVHVLQELGQLRLTGALTSRQRCCDCT